ncbi:pancreatic progenitor cell differentiation and proliferation factor-like [Meles meles]|uniref:pancreatic progenitor cell differentiation and proliferation factor-like n=1 Tax=Meles meles TaxID=9662 RepID=UPI001E699EC7|nr:pancreatic progenitor cell differentiation and proliferation factor-like [Meles meles]
MVAIPSSISLVAIHNYHLYPLDSTSSISSCRSAEYPGEAILHHTASFCGSLLSYSWLQCWSPQNAQNLPRPPGHHHL